LSKYVCDVLARKGDLRLEVITHKYLEDVQISLKMKEGGTPQDPRFVDHTYDPEKEDRLWEDR
jgi:hypothetical protein